MGNSMQEEDWTSEDLEEERKEVSTKGTKLQDMVIELSQATQDVHDGNFRETDAKKMAALALTAQLAMSEIVADATYRAKQAKLNVIEAESKAGSNYRIKAASAKASGEAVKLTDAAIKEMISKDEDMVNAKLSQINTERESQKYELLFNVLKDAHIFFRNYENS